MNIKPKIKIILRLFGVLFIVFGIALTAGGAYFPGPVVFVAIGGLFFCFGSNIPFRKANSSDPMVCPKCQRGYDRSWNVCLYDATPLINNPSYSKEGRG